MEAICCVGATNERAMWIIMDKCVLLILMMDAIHRKLYFKVVAFYQNLIHKGEEEDLARDTTNKWAAKKTKVSMVSIFELVFFLIVIVLLNSYAFCFSLIIIYIIKYEQVLESAQVCFLLVESDQMSSIYAWP